MKKVSRNESRDFDKWSILPPTVGYMVLRSVPFNSVRARLVPAPVPTTEHFAAYKVPRSDAESNPHDAIPIAILSEYEVPRQAAPKVYSEHIPKVAPVTEAERVAYLGESTSLSMMLRDGQGMKDAVHYPLPDTVRGVRAQLTELNHIEIELLS